MDKSPINELFDKVQVLNMEINLLNHFDKAYCINLDRRPDRWNMVQEEFTRCNVKGVERYAAIDGTTLAPGLIKPGALGLKETFLNIIKEAKDKEYKNVCIFEDDVIFCNGYQRFDEYLTSVPPNWDMIYFGVRHVWQPYKINDNILKVMHGFTTHSMVISRSMYNRIIFELGPRNDIEIDVYLAHQHKYINAYSFYPNITNQRADFSDVENRQVNYMGEIEQRFGF
jgi:glycosyl transferase family 25